VAAAALLLVGYWKFIRRDIARAQAEAPGFALS
jgi:hypothetical protein